LLALGFGDGFNALAGRLRVLNYVALRADLTEEGVRALQRSGAPIRAVMLSSRHSLGDLSFALDRLRGHAPTGLLRFVAAGPRAGHAALGELSRAGVEFALWDPYDDAALRFVLNQASHDPRIEESRRSPRVPTRMLARVFSHVGEKTALVYNISEEGAFLETPRPTCDKGHIRLEIPLPSGTVTLAAQVITTNVPGNIEKNNLPMGMGLRFIDVPKEIRKALAEHVAATTELFRIGKPNPD
jgi:hypothetical protein